jgi:hypothetical protein
VSRAAVLIVCLAVAACGGEDIERDHTASFVACLKRHGGTAVRAAPQLARLPWGTAEAGSSFGLERLVLVSGEDTVEDCREEVAPGEAGP